MRMRIEGADGYTGGTCIYTNDRESTLKGKEAGDGVLTDLA